MKLNKYNVNMCIKTHLLADKEMKKIGFTDYREGYWYFCRDLGDDISFNITISKSDPEDLDILVIDEEFGQPYDYQCIISHGSLNKFALTINEKVEYLMEILQNKGILSGHVKGEYI
jgi:hypothetical protein